jgi:exopolysaccharide biosynthesis polyprenyl glycosylphosphotransferase
MSTISTRETLASRESELAAPASKAAQSRPRFPKFLAGQLVRKMTSLGVDLLAITFAHMLAMRIAIYLLNIPATALNPFEYHRVYIPFFAVVLYVFDGYKSPELRRPEQELRSSCRAVGISFLALVVFNYVVFRSEVFSRYLIVCWFLLSCVLVVAVRFTLRALNETLWKAGMFRRRAVLVGSEAGLREYQQLLSIQRHHGCEVVAVLADSNEIAFRSAATSGNPILGRVDQWEDALTKTSAGILIVAHTSTPEADRWLAEVLRRCKQLRIEVELYSCLLASANMNFEYDEFSGCFRFQAKSEWSLALQRAIKRLMDVAIGFIGSVLTLLLVPVIFVISNLEERGPLFYRSAYLAHDGRTLYYLKFRTMRVDADQILETDAALRARFHEHHKLVDDPRVTKIGRILRKSSLDEFPQFFSVLMGDLTFVGPRTIRDKEAARYGANLQRLLSVKPGLTGFWQVMGRQTTTYQERIYMDMFYLDRWSIWLDLVIIAKTFWKVLKAEGAY